MNRLIQILLVFLPHPGMQLSMTLRLLLNILALKVRAVENHIFIHVRGMQRITYAAPEITVIIFTI